MLRIILCVLVSAVAGCANYQMTTADGKPTDFAIVFNKCMADANIAEAKAAADGINTHMNKGLLVRHCMAANGYAPL